MTRKYSSISVETTLASGISNSATTMTVASGTGSALMGGVTLTAGNVDIFTVALDVDTQNEEIVYITAVSSDTFTIVRGQAGTSAISHTGGATVKHVLTSADLTFYTAGVATADAAIPNAIVTAKGDIIAASASAVPDNLAIGTNGQVLTADSTETLGMKWSTAATGDVTLTGTQTLTNKTLTSPVLNDPKLNLSINANTATTYTFVLTDNGKLVTSSNASAQTLSIPTNASVAFPIGTQINVIQIGAGQVTVNAVTSGTTTVLSNAATAAAPKTRNQYAALTAIKVATDAWYVIGDIA
jgi:hypothetical protein